MYTAEFHQNVFDMKYTFMYQKGFKFGAAVTSLGMYYTSNKICPRIYLQIYRQVYRQIISADWTIGRTLPNAISEKRSLATRRDATHTHTFALVGYATSIKIRRRRVCADDDGGAQGAQDVPAAVALSTARRDIAELGEQPVKRPTSVAPLRTRAPLPFKPS